MSSVDKLLKAAEEQSEMTIAIIDMFIDYNKLLKKQIIELREGEVAEPHNPQ